MALNFLIQLLVNGFTELGNYTLTKQDIICIYKPYFSQLKEVRELLSGLDNNYFCNDITKYGITVKELLKIMINRFRKNKRISIASIIGE